MHALYSCHIYYFLGLQFINWNNYKVLEYESYS